MKLVTNNDASNGRIVMRTAAIWPYRIGVITLLVIAVVKYFTFRDVLWDDAYIAFRASWNLAFRGYFQYNNPDLFPVKGVLVTTSPLFALLLSIPGKIFRTPESIPTAAAVLSSSAIFILPSFIFTFFVRERRPLIGYLIAISYLLLNSWWILISMETDLFLLFIVASSFYFARNQFILSGVLAGLAIATRGDALILLPILPFLLILFTRKIDFKALAAFALSALITVAAEMAVLYYLTGAVLPSTLKTKIAVGKLGLHGASFLASMHGDFASILVAPGILSDAILVLYVCIFVLVAVGLSLKIVRHRAMPSDIFLVAPWIFGLLQALAYSFLGVPADAWYKAPIVISLFFGATALIHFGSSGEQKGLHKTYSWFGAGVIALVLATNQYAGPRQTAWTHNGLYSFYRQLANYLNRTMKPGETVALTEIGIIGYYLRPDVRVLDWYGITYPSAYADVLDDSATAIQEAARSLLEKERPDYLMDPAGFANMKDVLREYVLFNQFNSPVKGVTIRFFSKQERLSYGKELRNFDFEEGTLAGWTSSNPQFKSSVVSEDAVSGIFFLRSGKRHFWGWKPGGDPATGVLLSDEFKIAPPGKANFLISGGNNTKELSFGIECNGIELKKRRATGNNSEVFRRVYWNLSSQVGKTCRFKMVDNATGSFGHLNLDDVHITIQ